MSVITEEKENNKVFLDAEDLEQNRNCNSNP